VELATLGDSCNIKHCGTVVFKEQMAAIFIKIAASVFFRIRGNLQAYHSAILTLSP